MQWFKDNWNVVKPVGLSLIALIAIAFLMTRVESCGDNREIRKANEKVNAAVQEAVNVNAQLANLQQKKIETDMNANLAIKEAENALQATNAAQANTNAALNNVNAVRNGNYNGTDYTESLRRLCEAYPDDINCPK